MLVYINKLVELVEKYTRYKEGGMTILKNQE